jgi:putative ATP-dependent endonuclease of OLD family
VSDEWTLEYDLAVGPKDATGARSAGLAEELFVAASLAAKDEDIHGNPSKAATERDAAMKDLARLREKVGPSEGCSKEEVLAAKIYRRFDTGGVSKPVAAQYLAAILEKQQTQGNLKPAQLRGRLPHYLVAAIDYVTTEDSGAAMEDGSAES